MKINMTFPHKRLIARGVFAVSVVAITATVGIIGFAQAAPGGRGGNGYGTGIGQLQAAFAQFEQAIQSATSQFNANLQSCFADSRPSYIGQGLNAGNFDTGRNVYLNQLDQTMTQFRSQVSSNSAMNMSSSQFGNLFGNAFTNESRNFGNDQNQLSYNMNYHAPRHIDTSGLTKCIQKAQNKYLAAIDTARNELIAAIRAITH